LFSDVTIISFTDKKIFSEAILKIPSLTVNNCHNKEKDAAAKSLS